MENNLENIALRLQGIIDTAIDGIITIDSRGIVETVNNSAASLFKYNPSEIIGNNIKMLMPEPYHGEHDDYIKAYNKTRVPKIIGSGRDVIGKKKDGQHFPFRLAVSEVILNDRVIFTGIIHDLTDLTAAEQRLIQLNEKLEERVELRTNELEEVVNELLSVNKDLEEKEKQLNTALSKEKELNELKSRFVSMASHEFRTPLSTILSSVALIGKYNDKGMPEKSVKHIKRIKSSVNNLTGILNDFLSLSKIEAGKVELKLGMVNLSDLCEDIILDLKLLLKGNKKIECIHNQNSKEILTDIGILKNILFNLTSNAVKYTSEENGFIKLEVNESDNFIIFLVEDNGIGIPASEQKHLFDRFFRASNVENIQGTGLGLNIVKRYVNLLGGDITFQSKHTVGTSFTLKIPKQYEKNISN